MSGGAAAAAQLLKLNDGEFNSTIQDMSVKQLLETISYIQKEMGREQENFNSLNTELGNLKKNSGQYKSVSKDMAASQRRLTTLMDRSMKCFSQQGQQQSKESSSQKPVSQNKNSTELAKPKTETPSINPFVEMKPLKRVEKRVSSPSREQVPPVNMSFTEAKNRFSGNSQNGSANNIGKPKVPADVKRTQSMGSAVSTKRWSADVTNGTSVDSKQISDIGNNKPDNRLVTSNVDNVTSSNVSTKPSKPALNTTLAPLANQNNKFMSKSSDNVFNQSCNKVDDKDVVKGNVSNSKPMIVMTADRQYLDLDSFTDRKNLLSELKSFNKDLKPVARTDPRTKDHAIGQPNLVKSFGFENVKHDNKTSVQKVSLLNDIRLGKKPSNVKNGEVENIHNKSAAKAKDKTEDQKTTPGDIKKIESANGYKGVDEVDSVKSIDDVLDNVRGTEEAEALTSEIIVTNEKEALPGSSQSDDSESQSSELSEDDDKFVSEFSFPQKQAVPQSSVKTAPAIAKTGPALKVIPEHGTGQQQSKPDVQNNKNNKEAPKQVIQSGSQASKNPQGKVHVVKDNEEVLGAALGNQPEYNEDGEELVKQTRVNYSNWDPSLLLAELYRVIYMPDNIEDISHKFIGMEGLMEKLPMNKKKATLLKTWKRRFFRAKDGWLHYYETSSRDKPSDSLQLMGGRVEELGNRVLGVDDGRGKYLMVRVPTEHEYGQWKVALESQTADNVKATYVRPAPASAPNPKKKVIVIDIGSSGIRAGILGERATLPHVFFPSVVAINKKTKEIIVGADAYVPETRQSSNIIYPIRPTNKVDKFNIDMEVMSAVVKKVFSDLRVNPKEYLVMLSTPQNLGNTLKEGLMRILINQNHVKGVCMVQQALLALYSYNAMSGIIVDIGERLEILPIYEGLLIESGLSHQAYGGTKIQDSMYTSLLQNRYQFLTPVGRLVVRYICEQTCHVVDNYKDAKAECDKDSKKYTRTVDLQNFQLPQGAHQSVTLDHACFKSPEGFFNTDLWEMDYKNIQKQIFAAIQQCPMDSRKQMYRSIYLSGGVTMIPGFAERLQLEMEKLAPPAAVVEVHASPQRYHAAYIGACAVALMDVFEMSCVMSDEWNKMGVQACRKWGTN